jgi:hypothetical protein
MIKKALTIVFVAFTFATANSQKISLGAYTGLNLTDIHEVDLPELYGFKRFSSTISFNFNSYISFGISKRVRINFEQGLIRKGAIDNMDREKKLKMYYLNSPLILEVKPFKKFAICFGPELNYLVFMKEKSPDESNILSIENPIDICGIIGFDYEIDDQMSLGVRYNHGLFKYSETSWYDNYNKFLGQSSEYTQYLQVYMRFVLWSMD